MEGDNNGAMNLESSLTRAELAVILAHLNGDPEHLQTEQERYYKYCQFQDVPEWARVWRYGFRKDTRSSEALYPPVCRKTEYTGKSDLRGPQGRTL